MGDKALREEWMQAYLTLDAYGDVAACLGTLREAGLKTAILSNGSPRMLDAAVSSAGLGPVLDAALSIEDVGIYKPDARVYRLAGDALGIAPAAICFVSTNAWDASGAAHFGFQVVWLNRFKTIPERLPGRLVGTIGGLADLSHLIGRYRENAVQCGVAPVACGHCLY